MEYDAVILVSAVYGGSAGVSRAFVAFMPATSHGGLSSPAAVGCLRRVIRWDRLSIAVETTTGAGPQVPDRLIGGNLSLGESSGVTGGHLPYSDFRPWDDIID